MFDDNDKESTISLLTHIISIAYNVSDLLMNHWIFTNYTFQCISSILAATDGN